MVLFHNLNVKPFHCQEIEIIAGVDIADNRINSYPVFTDIKDCEAKADAIIDFSSSKGTHDTPSYSSQP